MNGVTILHINNHTPILPLVAYGIIICVTIILITSFFIFTNKYKQDTALKFYCLLLFTLGLGIFLFGVYGHTTYKVTLSNTVSYNEFTAKYDVIKTEGKILTVQLKDTAKENNNAKEAKKDK